VDGDNTLNPAQLVGKQVRFKSDDDHVDCWHHRNGIQSGKVLRVGQSLAQKAELLGTENLSLPDMDDEPEPPRVWVKVDPCPSFPRGCEIAVEVDCIIVA
jgi:hypothetical protein